MFNNDINDPNDNSDRNKHHKRTARHQELQVVLWRLQICFMQGSFYSWTTSWKKTNSERCRWHLWPHGNYFNLWAICFQSLCTAWKIQSALRRTPPVSATPLFSELIKIQNNLNKITTLTFSSNTIIIAKLDSPGTKGYFIFWWSHTSSYTWKNHTVFLHPAASANTVTDWDSQKAPASREHDKSQIRWAASRTRSSRKGIIWNPAFWQSLLHASVHAASLNDV